MPGYAHDQVLALQALQAEMAAQTTEIAAQTVALQQLTAAVQNLEAAGVDSQTIQKHLAESWDHYAEHMTGVVTHADPLP